jgi:ethanolaminephosphotransferase
MDKVIEEIYKTIVRWNKRFKLPAVLFVTGDHGMRDSGGHGGSSTPETEVPFIVIGTDCKKSDKMYQLRHYRF